MPCVMLHFAGLSQHKPGEHLGGEDSGRYLHGLPPGGEPPPAWEVKISLDIVICLMLYTHRCIMNDKALVQLTDAFKGLADPTRLRILNLLLHGELCGCDIQVVLETPQPNASRHLTYLKRKPSVG